LVAVAPLTVDAFQDQPDADLRTRVQLSRRSAAGAGGASEAKPASWAEVLRDKQDEKPGPSKVHVPQCDKGYKHCGRWDTQNPEQCQHACVRIDDISDMGTSKNGACSKFSHPHLFGFWRKWEARCKVDDGEILQYFKKDMGGKFRVEPRPPTARAFSVKFYVTRHGFSCTNFVEKYLAKWDFKRGFIPDPMLTASGADACRAAGDEVPGELDGRPPDVLISSKLLRAIETGLWVYSDPGIPLVVAPFIHEKVMKTPSNSAVEPAEQVRRLSIALGDAAAKRVKYEHRSSSFVDEAPDWNKFKQFVAEMVLPKVIQEPGMANKTDIVVAVITHSMFLNADGDVAKKCKKHWSTTPDAKMRNVMTVAVEYDWRGEWGSPLTLKDEVECKVIAQGQQIDTKKGFGLQDIGGWCREHILRHASGRSISMLDKPRA